MTKKQIGVLLGMMIVSLVGVLIVQFIWIARSYRVAEQQFERNTRFALGKTQGNMQPFFFEHKQPVRTTLIKREKHLFDKDSLMYNVILSDEDYTYHHSSSKNGSSYSYTTGKAFSRFEDSLNKAMIKFHWETDSMLREEIEEEEVEEMEKTISIAHIDPQKLDSIIEINLESSGIHEKFIYAIVREHDSVVFSSRDTLDQTTYSYVTSVQSKDGPVKIEVQFPDRNKFLMRELGWQLGLSVLFSLMMLLTFWLALRMIIRQKKVAQVTSDFINNMTHEFKTPLATIGVASDSIVHPEIIENPSKIKEYNQLIKTEAKRLNRQVEEVLKASQLKEGQIILQQSSINIKSLWQEIYESVKPVVDNKGGQIQLDLEQNLPDMQGDAFHLENTFRNVVDNAIKYSGDAPPQVVVRVFTENQYLVSEVKDKGIGISRPDQRMIFDRFYRVHTGNRHDVKGFGLGLNYALEIVRLTGGAIELDSKLGEGSTFRIKIPLNHG